MTHTEESLMALADAHADFHWHAGEEGRDGVYCPDSKVARESLRLAIREVLAELANAHGVAQACEARAEKAEAEVKRLKAGGCARNQGLTQYCAEAEALRKDAARYRWIEKQINIYGAEWAPATVANAIVRGDGARLDDAIDSAIKDQP